MEEVKDFVPEPEGIENLVGVERTEEVIDTAEIQQEVPQIDPRERAQRYYEGMKLTRDQYKSVKRMDREDMQNFLNRYVMDRTQKGMALYAEIMLNQYLEVLTGVLKNKFGFTDEQIEELNKAIENRNEPEETNTENNDIIGVDVATGEDVTIEEVKE